MASDVSEDPKSHGPDASVLELCNSVRDRHELLIAQSAVDGLGASVGSESFSNWSTLGAAAIGSFWIVQANELLPLVSKTGYLIAGALLALTALLGVVARYAHSVAQSYLAGRIVGAESVKSGIRAYEEEMEKYRDVWAASIAEPPELRIESIFEAISTAMPWWHRWLFGAHARKVTVQHPLAGQLFWPSLHSLLCGLQGLCFVLFLVLGLVFAAAEASK